MTAPLIQLSNIHLSYGAGESEVAVLRGVSFSAQRGESVALVGPSGAGKTSLMMIAAGLEQPTRGEVLIDSHALHRMKEPQLAAFRRDHIGIVFQQFHLMPTLTARENVALPLAFIESSAEAHRAAEVMLESVGLSHRLSHYPAQLSGGEQQRVAIARALMSRPSLLLADEPTGNLDETTGKQVIDLLFSKAKEYGATLLLITHDKTLSQRCDRKVEVRDGGIV